MSSGCYVLLAQNSKNVPEDFIKNDNKIKLKEINFKILLEYLMIFEEDGFYVYINDKSTDLDKVLNSVLILFNRDSKVIFNFTEAKIETVTTDYCRSILGSLYNKDHIAEDDIKELINIKISEIFTNNKMNKFDEYFRIKINQQNIKSFVLNELSISEHEYNEILPNLEKALLRYTFFLLKLSANKKTNNNEVLIQLNENKKEIKICYKKIDDLLHSNKKFKQKIENYSFIFNKIKERKIFNYLKIEK